MKRFLQPPSVRGKSCYSAKGATVLALYAIYCQGFAKIGLATDIKRRLQSMQTANPFPISLLSIWSIPAKDAIEAEDAALLALDDAHHRGDWFRCSKERAVAVVTAVAERFGGSLGPPPRRPTSAFRPGRPSRLVVTPTQEFASAAEAAAAHGITRQTAWLRAKNGVKGWSFGPTHRRSISP
jgi:hypothetical protein